MKKQANDIATVGRIVKTRVDTRKEVDELFNNADKGRAKDRALIEKHFVQAPLAHTQAPTLQKTAEEEKPKKRMGKGEAISTLAGTGVGVAAAFDKGPKVVKKVLHAPGRLAQKGLNAVSKKIEGKHPIKGALLNGVGQGLAQFGSLQVGQQAGRYAGRAVDKIREKKEKTAHVDAFFKTAGLDTGLTEAQKRYPELLKVAKKRPGISDTKGAMPTRDPVNAGAP